MVGFAASVGFFVFFLVFGGAVMSLFGDNFVEAWPILIILAVGLLVEAAMGPIAHRHDDDGSGTHLCHRFRRDHRLCTLYDKIWDDHVVMNNEDGTSLLYIDRHLVHEVTSPQAFEGLRITGRKVARP
jgi:hypothetical protein